jgi:hypothetical protein
MTYNIEIPCLDLVFRLRPSVMGLGLTGMDCIDFK